MTRPEQAATERLLILAGFTTASPEIKFIRLWNQAAVKRAAETSP